MDVEQRLTRLETDLTQLREEWAVVQQAPLIQARLLNALRATQVEHSVRLAEHSVKLAEVDAKLAEVDAKLAEHDARFDKLDRGQEMIVGMLTTLIEREPGEQR